MAATSKHWADVLIWLDKVLDSCITMDQVDNTRKLINEFEKIYNPHWNTDEINDSICELFRKSAIKRDEIFNELLEQKLKL